MCIRKWLGRQAKGLAVASLILASGGAAEAQLLPLPFPLPVPLPLPLPLPLPSTVNTDKGSLIGQSTNGIRQYLGIPYAAPPVGAARWKPPAPENSYTLRDASKFAKHCPQVATPYGQASTDEDCLYLNVFSPASSLSLTLQPAPVMVWLHPGSFQYGESDDYNPIALVKRGFVVVTVNYRLGALGFMAHPALSAESGKNASGNYGLMDQQAALRWVQRNIKNFDGDPKNVTIFGQGSGGVSVYAHLASPGSAGLFQRAIAQSGTYVGYYPQQTLAAAEAEGQALATAIGCAPEDIACMRAAPVSTIIDKLWSMPTYQPSIPAAPRFAVVKSNPRYLPHVDGAVLPQGILSALDQGKFNRVPVLQGTTQNEFRWLMAQRELEGFPLADDDTAMTWNLLLGLRINSAESTMLRDRSNFPSEEVHLDTRATGIAFSCRSVTIAHHLAEYVPVWVYEFDDPNAPQEVLPAVSFPYLSYHGAEVQYLLDEPSGAATLSASQKQLADSMKIYWTQFARTGNPNGGSAPAWPSYQDTPIAQNAVNAYLELTLPAPRPFNRGEFAGEHECERFQSWMPDYEWSPEAWEGP